MRRTPSTRRGFTLIELLVAAALSLVVMTVLSLAFQTGMQTLSQLKSVVGLAEQLRAAEGVIRRDLFAYHLEADQSRPVRVSSSTGNHIKGYFAFTQGGWAQTSGGPVGAGTVPESAGLAASDSPQSFRTQPANLASQLFNRSWMDHVSFTVQLTGEKPQAVFTAPAVGDPSGPTLLSRLRSSDSEATPAETRSADPTSTQLASRWAEVSYLLIPAGPSGGSVVTVFTNDEGGLTKLPLYTLYRRQRVLANRSSPLLNTIPPFGSVTTSPYNANDADVARGVAMAQPNGGANPWVVLGPEGVAGVSSRPASDPLRAVEIATQMGNRLGGSNDQLAPSVAAAPTPEFQQDLRRRGYPIPSGKTEYGSDVLLSNVVSMTVRPVYSLTLDQNSTTQLQTHVLANPAPASRVTPLVTGVQYPTTQDSSQYTPRDMPEQLTALTGPVPGFPRFYDTAGGGFTPVFRVGGQDGSPGSNAILNGANVGGAAFNPVITGFKLKALEVKLRVYDAKNKTTRQVTILQDL